MSKPDKADINAIAGGALGAKSIEEARLVATRTDDLRSSGNQQASMSDLRFDGETDSNASNKYPTDPSIMYHSRGALSVRPDTGKLVFTDINNEPSRAAFMVDKSDSLFYSTNKDTVLGSLNISTVDGYELNQMGATYPSTNFSPTKAWNKQILPSLPVRGITSIAILALIQQTLNKLLKGLNSNTTAETITRKEDMATIIVDNAEIEEELFSEYFD